jgi:uncharacterized protein (DUF2236 family)
MSSPLEVLRGRTARALRTVVPVEADGPWNAAAEDTGLSGPDSVTWRVHAHFSMLVGGIRALLMQTLHPLAMAGVAQHSDYRTDSLGRLQRTSAFIAATTYGSTATAEAAVQRVRRVHERVRGVAGDGRPYSAADPALLAWVHYVEVDSFLVAYQRVGPGLTGEEADRYVQEMGQIGDRMGVVDRITTASALHSWVVDHPEQRVTPEARAAARFLVAPPLPAGTRAAYTVLLGAAISLLPLRQRKELGLFLPGPIGGRLLCEPAARALVGVLGWATAAPKSPQPISSARSAVT